jgi:two-component system, sporulation sensor kinase D
MTLDLKRLNEIADRFYKIGSKPKLIEIDLLDLSNEISNYIRERIPKKLGIELSVKGDHSHVLGAKTLLGWAIENLLKNSIDASKGGSRIIQINLSKDDSFVNLDVSDNGIGIPRSNWKNIFSAGFSEKKKGWGLGLSLTKRIIENIHQGKIYVTESSIKRTVIRVKIPIYKSVN